MRKNDAIYRAIDTGGGQTCDVPGVLQALDAAGFVIVPRDPTEAMMEAGNAIDTGGITDPGASAFWAVMIDAALDKIDA